VRRNVTLEKKMFRVACRVLRELKEGRASVDIYLVDEKVMKSLNRKFRGKDKPTDVLSFKEPAGFPHPERKGKYLGEIYLAPGVAKKKGNDLEALLIHGLLHLLGYTHKRKSDRIKMEKLERRLEKHG